MVGSEREGRRKQKNLGTAVRLTGGREGERMRAHWESKVRYRNVCRNWSNCLGVPRKEKGYKGEYGLLGAKIGEGGMKVARGLRWERNKTH